MSEIKSLYTAKEVKAFKEEQIAKQNGIDPILGEEFPKGTICMDHDHSSQHCRAALHLQTNVFDGKIVHAYTRCLKWLTDVPLPQLLRNLATYLEQDYSSNPYHPGWTKAVKTNFAKLSSKQQNFVLESLCNEIRGNPKERKELFAEIVLDRSLGYARIVEVINQAKELT